MFWTMLGAALAGTATLHVGVHRQAGGVYDIAADGAAGLCVAGPARISCPADGPVTFRWAGGPGWELVGQAVVEPEAVGVAWVLATEESRVAERGQLAGGVDRDTVLALFSPAPGIQALAPSRSMIDDLVRLARHPDPMVRRSVVDALVPLWRHTSSDPFPPEAPEILPDGLITLMATDPDIRVRRRLASQLRELNDPSVAQREEVLRALVRLVDDQRTGVQRAATGSLRAAVAEDTLPAEQSWAAAMERVARPGGAGRAAANTLGWLARELEPSDTVVPTEAVYRVLNHHPERAWSVWYAWRDAVPYDHDRALRLLRETVGLHRGLIRHWAEEDPVDLALLLRDWEPTPPHGERWRVVREWLTDQPSPELRSVLGLPALVDPPR